MKFSSAAESGRDRDTLDPRDLAAHRLPLAARVFARCYLRGEFRLRSGDRSGEYLDKYLFESEPQMLHEIAQGLVGLLPEQIDAFAGLELGGVPIATVCSHVSQIPTLFVRKRPKNHGTCRLIEGGWAEGMRVAVVEDVISSGGAVIDSCRALWDQGARIVVVLAVLDRELGAAESLAREGLELRSLFTMSELRRARVA